MSKTALVTGACGFVGSHMVKLLLDRGYHVIATDLPNADRTWLDPRAQFQPADLTKPKDLDFLKRIQLDQVFHTASLFRYSASYDQLYKVNVEGTRNLCEALLDKDLESMVHWSSIGVYGPPCELPATEDCPKNPSNNYELTKWEQEKLVMEYHSQHGLPVVAIRPAPIYGPRNRYGVYTLLEAISKLGFMLAPSVYPRTKQTRFPLVHVDDVVNSALHLAGYKPGIGQSYNIVDDSQPLAYEFLEFVAPLLGANVSRVPVHYPVLKLIARLMKFLSRMHETRAIRKGVPPKIERDIIGYITGIYHFSNQKLKSTGYKLIYPDYREGMVETILWYKQHGWL